MCFFGGGGGGDGGAREAEEARQARIGQGRVQIDNAFAGFNDDFFGQIQSNASNFFNDDLNRQFKTAKRGLIFNQARSGNLNASAGARQIANLNELFARNQSFNASKARDEATSARGKVEDSRGRLVNQLVASADPSLASTGAVNAAQHLAEPTSFNPLSSVFADFLNIGATGVRAERSGNRGFSTGLFNTNTSSSGSSRVVN